MPGTRKGFTILELMLVMAIIIMLMAMALPEIETMYLDMRVQAGGDHLRARFAQARSRAIEEGQPYRFAVKPTTGEYRLAPDTSDYWDENSNPKDATSSSATGQAV